MGLNGNGWNSISRSNGEISNEDRIETVLIFGTNQPVQELLYFLSRRVDMFSMRSEFVYIKQSSKSSIQS